MADSKATVVKKVSNMTLFSDGRMKLDNVRLSYPHLDAPYGGDDNDGGQQGGKKGKSVPKYSVVGIMPKATHKEAQALLIEQINKVCKEKKWWKEEGGKGRRTIPSDKLCIKNGDDSGKDEYANAWTISAREVKAPKLRDRKKNNVPQEKAADVFYAGCWANIVIRLWPQDNEFGKRVNASLDIVQFVRDDESFGEGRLNDEDADDFLDTVDGEDASGDDGLDDDDMDDL